MVPWQANASCLLCEQFVLKATQVKIAVKEPSWLSKQRPKKQVLSSSNSLGEPGCIGKILIEKYLWQAKRIYKLYG